ncbi:MAG: hypothetical protein ABSD31_18440 [Candidatus Binataceae bacterium]
MADRNLIIESAARVKKLREELEKAEAELDRLLGSGSRARKTRPQKPQPARGTMTGKILKTLETSPKQTFSPAQLAERLAIKNIKSLKSTLLRLAQRRSIRKVGSGAYAARQLPNARS